MLRYLTINNFLLFKKQEISFTDNFTVITGETGSGKSMFIKALSFVLGEKTENKLTEANSILVIAEFKINRFSKNLAEILEENQIELEDDCLIIRRNLDPFGKGKIFINDVPVTLKLLKSISYELVEFHSQHKQIEAFTKTNSLNLIDQFIVSEDLKLDLEKIYNQIKNIEKKISEDKKLLQEIIKDQEYFAHGFSEIDNLQLKEDEEQELVAKKKVFFDKIKIQDSLKHFLAEFSRDEGINQKIIKFQKNLSKLEIDNPTLNEKIEKTIDHINELHYEVETELNKLDRLENIEYIEERISKIRELSRKHRCSASQLLIIAEQFKAKLSQIDTIETSIKSDLILKNKLHDQYIKLAEKLSEKRKVIAKELEEKIALELRQLNLEQVEFKIEIYSDQTKISSKGFDECSFLIKPNQGFKFAEVSEIASGGEISRIMLAFKVALAATNQIETIIFDEIDTGTGGAVAEMIGNRMKQLSQNAQIIAISHLPQVAAKAGQHLLMTKSNDQRAQTNITTLTSEEKITEIARMLAGINITDEAIKAAIRLIER